MSGCRSQETGEGKPLWTEPGFLLVWWEGSIGKRWWLDICEDWKRLRTLRPHGLQHVKLPCPSLAPRVCSDSCLLSQWCYPATSSSATPFSFCPQSFPASGSFPMCGSSHQVAKISELQLQHQHLWHCPGTSPSIREECRSWSNTLWLPSFTWPLKMLPCWELGVSER